MRLEAIGNGLRGRLTVWKTALLVILALASYAAFVRFSQGLGAATNLSDAFPWGLWIGFDLLCGVVLAAGGFTTSAACYIFGLKRFHSAVRPAILTASSTGSCPSRSILIRRLSPST